MYHAYTPSPILYTGRGLRACGRLYGISGGTFFRSLFSSTLTDDAGQQQQRGLSTRHLLAVSHKLPVTVVLCHDSVAIKHEVDEYALLYYCLLDKNVYKTYIHMIHMILVRTFRFMYAFICVWFPKKAEIPKTNNIERVPSLPSSKRCRC